MTESTAIPVQEDTEFLDHCRSVIGSQLHDTKLILLCSRPAALSRTVRFLRELGSADPFVIAGRAGTPLDGTRQYTFGDDASDSLAERVRQISWSQWMKDRLTHPPADLLQALDAYDPECRALVYNVAFGEPEQLLGRRRLGRRLPRWAEYEDKTRVDAFWDRCGIDRPPSTVVPAADAAAVAAAVAELDQGAGAVLAGDTRSGVHGGAVGLRLVRSRHDLDQALDYLRRISGSVRVAPFVTGIPCTIHGIVLEDEVAVFQPMEMLVLPRSSGDFVSTGVCNSFWAPRDPAATAAIRSLTRRVGERLREEAGYGGGFTVDGILAPGGFLPTELNARLGSGLGDADPVSGLPLRLLSVLAQERRGIDYRAADLERVVNRGIAEHPVMECALLLSGPTHATATRLGLRHAGTRLERCPAGDEPDVVLEVAPAGPDTAVSVSVRSARPCDPHGPMADLVVEALRICREVGLDTAELDGLETHHLEARIPASADRETS